MSFFITVHPPGGCTGMRQFQKPRKGKNMDNAFGELMGGAFRANEPTLDGMLQAIARNTDGGSAVAEPSEAQKKRDDLDRCYAQFAASNAGKRILDDLLDITLRSSLTPKGDLSIEAFAISAAQWQSKNDLIATILARIVRGQSLPAPGAKAKKSSKKKS